MGHNAMMPGKRKQAHMYQILIIAHGSRRAASNQAVEQLAQQMETAAGHPVRAAFLELAQPSIAEGIDACVASGADRLDILPYFLAPGRHVREDIPQQVQQAMGKHPHLNWQLLPHLGNAASLAEFMLQFCRQQSDPNSPPSP